jgi:uncharacterized caspase-like protein
MRFLLTVATLLLLFLTPFHAFAAGKVALVIGNGAYQNANKLPNPPNDASDMNDALTKLGFTVIGGTNLNHVEMAAKIGDFEDAARDADTTLFFYAGHGMQVDGRNYLVPVDAKLERPTSLQFETIDADVVLRSMAGPGKTAIALLDACRDNPLSRSFSRSLGKTRSNAVQQGLATPSVPGGGILIGFATAPGDVAADGEGRNSPFTTALLRNINTPGLEIQQLMTRVKGEVYVATKESQEPWHNSSLRNEVYLVAPVAKQEPDAANASEVIAPAEANTSLEWNAVKDTNSIGVLDAFIAAHVDSPVFVALAEDRKVEINAKLAADAATAAAQEKPKQEELQQEALADINPVPEEVAPPAPPQRSTGWTIDAYFELGKGANDGQTVYSKHVPTIIPLAAPPPNPGNNSRSVAIKEDVTASSLDALLASHSEVAFAAENVTYCRLDFIDRCPFLSLELVRRLSDTMTAKGMFIGNHNNNHFTIGRIANSEDLLLSNSPKFGKGAVTIVAAVIAPDMSVREVYAFGLNKNDLGLEGGAALSEIEVTGAAVDGDDFYISFDSGDRCTDRRQRYGFVAKFSRSDHSLKWVSPLSVSSANLLFSNGRLITAYGGSCVDDYIYALDMNTGSIKTRAKLPSAVERMDVREGRLTLELYDRAGVYQLP